MNEVLSELPEQARCQQCGYSIHRLTVDRCPECGSAFDRGAVLARLEKLQKKPFDKTAAAMLSAPPWWASAAALIAAILNLNDDQIPSVTSVLLFSTAAAAFVLRIIDRMRVSGRYDLTNRTSNRRVATNWIVLPIVLTLASRSTGNEISMRLAFAASYFQMHMLARNVIASRSYPPDQWVGLYYAVYICPTSDGMNFRLAGHKQSGFAYTTTGQPPRCRPAAEWLGGGWYFFSED